MKEILEKLVSKNTINFGKCKTLEDYAELENNFVKELLKAISVTPCCTELKDKEALTWKEWKGVFVEKESNGKFLHKNGNWYNYADLSWKYQSYKQNL